MNKRAYIDDIAKSIIISFINDMFDELLYYNVQDVYDYIDVNLNLYHGSVEIKTFNKIYEQKEN